MLVLKVCYFVWAFIYIHMLCMQAVKPILIIISSNPAMIANIFRTSNVA